MNRPGIFMSALIVAATCVHGNGPAWVAELSTLDPAHTDRLAITIPAGSHAAVAVYNTDAIAPQCPPGMTATVRVIWYEHRTAFVGQPSQRDIAVPYYLPQPQDCAPTGSWVVELHPAAPGVYAVPIVCNSNTVTVTVTVIDLPASDIGYGFYTDAARYADATCEATYLRDMAAHGMNTCTPYAREVGPAPWDYAECLRHHIDTAVAAGCADVRFPLLCLSSDPAMMDGARARAPYPWPELVGYNLDEPGGDKGPDVAALARRWHEGGYRTGTAIDGSTALRIGDPLDIWVLHMDSVTPERIAACRARGREFWMYNCALRGSNAAQHRYWTGVYTWALQPRVCLTWTYMHDSASRITPDGTWNLLRVYDTAGADAQGQPIPTVALEGLQEGIIDSRLLQHLERQHTPAGDRYLRALRARVACGFWTDGVTRETSAYPWDVPDTQRPPIDGAVVRAEVLRLLGYEP